MEQGMGGPSRRLHRLWLAAAGALALHALVLVLLMLLPRAKLVAPSRPRVLQVDLRVSPPAAPTATTVPQEKHARGGGPARKAAPPAGATELPAGTGATAESGPAPWSRDWQVGEGLDRSGGELSLRLDHPEEVRGRDGGVEDEGSAGLVREKSREEKLAEEQATVQRRVEGWLSDAKAKGRAQSRDGYWQPIEDALGRGFNPGWDVLEHGPDKAPNSTLGALAEAWKKQAAAYGKSGNPFAGQPDPPGARKPLHDELIELPNEDRGLPSNLSLAPALNVGMLSAAASASGSAWHFRLVASVRIIQREDGSLLAVELLGKSGNAAYDRLVLGQARSLSALRLGPPKQGLETLWAFETDFSQIPPLPIVGCALDDFVPKNCWRPLQKMVRSRVRLQAIY